MKREHLEKATKDKTVLTAVKTVLMAKAYYETLKELIAPKQLEIVLKHQFKGKDESIISNPDYLYQANEDDFKVYMDELHAFYLNNGFKVEYGDCPLLMADTQLIKATQLMIDVLEKYTTVSYQSLMINFPENLNKYMDLTLGLFTRFVANDLNKFSKSLMQQK